MSDIIKDLKISPRKFYAILEKKKIGHKKYKKEQIKQTFNFYIICGIAYSIGIEN